MSGVALPALLAGLGVLALAGPGETSTRLVGALPGAARTTGPGRGPWVAGLRRRVQIGLLPAAACGGAVLGLVLDGAELGLVLAALSATGATARRNSARARAAAAERTSAVEACAALAAELRAGRAPGSALEASADVATGALQQRLRAGAAAARLGGDVAPALQAGVSTAVPEVVAGLAACWQVCAGTGSGLAAAVERLEEGVRGREAARRAVEAELAGPRATAGLLSVLPLAGVALAAGLGARPLHVLLDTTVGSVCLLVGVGLDLLGLAWSRRIARSAGV